MILNMTGAGSKAQFIPFTVASSTDINSNYFTVNNVKLPSGKVTGFYISRFSNMPYGDGAVFAVFREYPKTEVTSGLADAVYYNSNSSSYELYRMTSGEDFEYDDTNETFKFRVRLTTIQSNDAYLSAGDYQLVIW